MDIHNIHNITGLDSYSKHVFATWTQFGFISVLGLTALLKLKIIVCILWLSLPVH